MQVKERKTHYGQPGCKDFSGFNDEIYSHTPRIKGNCNFIFQNIGLSEKHVKGLNDYCLQMTLKT